MQCPIDFVATAAVVMTSIIIGAGCGIRPKWHDDWTVIPNLWGGVIGRPSMLKTPALAKGEYDSAASQYQAEVEMHEAKKKALKSKMLSMAQSVRRRSNPAVKTPSLLKKVCQLQSLKTLRMRHECQIEALLRRLDSEFASDDIIVDLAFGTPEGPN
jgi:hypothetical protein